MSNTDVETELAYLGEQYEDKIVVTFVDPNPASVYEDLDLTTLDLIRADCARSLVTDEDFVALCEDPLARGALGNLVERYLDWLTGGRGALFEVADVSERSHMFLEARA